MQTIAPQGPPLEGEGQRTSQQTILPCIVPSRQPVVLSGPFVFKIRPAYCLICSPMPTLPKQDAVSVAVGRMTPLLVRGRVCLLHVRFVQQSMVTAIGSQNHLRHASPDTEQNTPT